MKRVLHLIIVIMIALQVRAENSQPDDQSQGILLEYDLRNEKPKRHRAPIRIDIEAHYDSDSGAIVIENHGGYDGEAVLYLNNDVIEYNPDIETVFLVPGPGLYRIEIYGESWIATGILKL